MNLEVLQPYVVPGLLIAFFAVRLLRYRAVKTKLPGLLQGGAQVVDVRSTGEFSAGSRPGALNIPLGELAARAKKELDPARPVVVCCASGTRSGLALGMLKGQGFTNVVNAGPWQNTL